MVADGASLDELPEALESQVVATYERELAAARQESLVLAQNYKNCFGTAGRLLCIGATTASTRLWSSEVTLNRTSD